MGRLESRLAVQLRTPECFHGQQRSDWRRPRAGIWGVSIRFVFAPEEENGSCCFQGWIKGEV